MKLYTTTKSERGKEVTKGGNEYIRMEMINEKRESLLSLMARYENGIISIEVYHDSKTASVTVLDVQDIPL